jgi:hypothetical protein
MFEEKESTMLDFSVSWPQLLAVAFANFLVSWLYYSPMAPWFKAWVVGIGGDPEKRGPTEAEKREMPLLMGGALLSSFLLSYGLQVLVRSLGASGFWNGALVGTVAWLAFAVTHSLNTRFEGRKPRVLLINNGLYFFSYAAFAGLIAAWR